MMCANRDFVPQQNLPHLETVFVFSFSASEKHYQLLCDRNQNLNHFKKAGIVLFLGDFIVSDVALISSAL